MVSVRDVGQGLLARGTPGVVFRANFVHGNRKLETMGVVSRYAHWRDVCGGCVWSGGGVWRIGV
jgi:hypothetical protein